VNRFHIKTQVSDTGPIGLLFDVLWWPTFATFYSLLKVAGYINIYVYLQL